MLQNIIEIHIQNQGFLVHST